MRLQSYLSVEEDGHLICAVYHLRSPVWNDRHLYSFPLMRLAGNEFRLNAGRFNHFTLKQQQFRITVADFGSSENIIEWIAENVGTAWSMRLKPVALESKLQPNLEFSFDDSVTAGFFALRWR